MIKKCAIIVIFLLILFSLTFAQVHGRIAPELNGIDINGRPFSLSAYKGRTILVSFWAIWCDKCKKRFPHFAVLQNKYANRGFIVILVNIDPKDKWPNALLYLRSNNIYFPVLAFAEPEKLVNYRLDAIPFQIVIDKNFVVKWTGFSAPNDFEIEEILDTRQRQPRTPGQDDLPGDIEPE